jgi:hypothetical protein
MERHLHIRKFELLLFDRTVSPPVEDVSLFGVNKGLPIVPEAVLSPSEALT